MKIEKKFRKDLKAWRWGFDVTIMGQRIRRYEWELKRDATDALAALQTRARAHRYGLLMPEPQISLRRLLNKLEADKSLVARKDMIAAFNEFIEIIDPEKSLRQLTRADWKRYQEKIQERKLKPGTINQYICRVSSALHRAGDYFPELAEWRPPKALWLPEPLGRNRLLSNDEVSHLLAALRSDRQKGEHLSSMIQRQEVYDLFRLMLLTAAREGELLHLIPKSVSWDWKTAQIESKKGGGSRRVVPLSNSAIQILEARKKGLRFFKITPYCLYRGLQRAGEIAEIPYGERTEGGWVIYDVRHLAATVMENAGVPYSAVSAILGHKRRDQTATYTHVKLETLFQAVQVLEKHCRAIDGFFSKTWTSSDHTGRLRQAAGE